MGRPAGSEGGSIGGNIHLRVSEALAKDVGRGIARMDPKDMDRVGVTVGDIVEVTGKRTTVAKAMPAYPEDRGKDSVQIDGIIRGNAQAALDERVRVVKTSYQPAEAVALSAVGGSLGLARDNDTRYIARLLEGLPLVKGDTVRAALFGTRFQDFNVVDTAPGGVVTIHSTTAISVRRVEGEAERRERAEREISYEDIGGLNKEIQRIREMIELPLRYPEIFERLGIDAPKGVLLHGPPGTGKTLIARAVANETDAYFVAVNGPEIIHKFYGESEAKLRGIFEDASRHAPSIIFLDEIDAIAPKRAEVTGEVEKRVVAQLLGLMDGLKQRKQVIVIGATNIPGSLDPALRRPGRFDREISISVPDRNGRLEILEIHTRGMPLAPDVSLEKLSEITHGFVGADLQALCREAAMVSLRRVLPKIDFASDYIPYEVLLELEVTMDDFLSAAGGVEPSAIREVFVEVPDVRWDDIGGLDEVKRLLAEAVEWPLKYAKLFEYARISPPKGILLYGPPGTGKTLIAKAVANESQANFISIKGPSLMSKWVGESEKGVREVFKKARQASPSIIFFDEIDALAPIRGAAGDSHVTERVISQLLTEMDGVEELKGVVVLAATNRLDIVDPALLRAGRFDVFLEIGVPCEEARHQIYEVHTRGKPVASDVSLVSLARKSEGFVGSDIEAVCRRAAMLAIREYLEAKGGKVDEADPKFTISNRHFEEALTVTREHRGG